MISLFLGNHGMEISEVRLQSIANLANEMKILEQEIEELKELLKEKTRQHNEISAMRFPELMAEIGLQQFRLTDGTSLAIVPVFTISIPKERMSIANEWLVANNHDGMVKTRINLPRTDDEVIRDIIAQAQKRVKGLVTSERTINWQTLNAWGREMEQEGYVIPENIFNIFRSNKTIIE